MRSTGLLLLALSTAMLLPACGSSDDGDSGGTTDTGSVDTALLDTSPRDTGAGTDSSADAIVDSTVDSVVTDTGAVDSGAADSAADVTTDADALADTTDGGLAAACVASGGTVSTASCCASVTDFPNRCLIGACSCAPSSSHEVQVCNCAGSKCWNGSSCATP
jgi:hypothetical protein